jgi:cytoskeleton protein RodZ
MSEFGTRFKTTRQSMGLTLDQIAAETRIGTRFLEAIENEQFDRLPGGIFSRGFIRSYAERLKLDPEQAVADFERQSTYKEPAVMELRVIGIPPDKTSRTLYPVAAIGALVALVILFYVVTKERGRPVSDSQTAVNATAPAAAPHPVIPSAEPSDSNPPATTAEQPPVPNASAVNPSTAAPARESLTILLSARKRTWIRVIADGASTNPGEILQPGTTRRYTAQTSIKLSLGNAGGVDVQVNDHSLRPLGKDGQVRSVKITPENLKDLVD